MPRHLAPPGERSLFSLLATEILLQIIQEVMRVERTVNMEQNQYIDLSHADESDVRVNREILSLMAWARAALALSEQQLCGTRAFRIRQHRQEPFLLRYPRFLAPPAVLEDIRFLVLDVVSSHQGRHAS
nr:hypothetical protein B0A51_03465 [Rachicladosporium sp. CCFEE 5018]